MPTRSKAIQPVPSHQSDPRSSSSSSRRRFLAGSGAALASLALGGGFVPARAQSPSGSAVLFENVRIFDGVTDGLSAPSNVLVIGNRIERISPEPVEPPQDIAVTRIAGEGRTLMPGLIDAAQFTVPEIRAVVEADENWGTYMTVHAYTSRAGNQALDAGVKCIEHGHLFDEATVQRMADEGLWWCMQPFLDDQDAQVFVEGSSSAMKQKYMFAGTDKAHELAIKHNVKTSWGSDIVFDPKLTLRQGAQLSKLTRRYSPFEVLKKGTSDNAELLALSGLRCPYEGKLGVVQEGALADLLLMDGDPLANIRLIEDPATNFRVIMKDGVVYKNALA
jgi:imidazolonepropionase-like amidohydrolase